MTSSEKKITIESIPFSGVVKVFDMNTSEVIFDGTEDTIPKNILLQIPVKVYCVDDVMYIDVRYEKVYYDTEAKWYYYESFLRSQYNELSEQEKRDWYHGSFSEYVEETLKYEPIEEVKGGN